MPKEQSDASPIKSSFGGGWIYRPQALAEDACRRLALNKKQDLRPEFWKDPVWERTFLTQLRHANSLLKTYPYEAVTRALRTPEGRKCYSLNARWLDPLIKVEVARIERAKALAAEQAVLPPTPAPPAHGVAPRPSFVPTSKRSNRLDDLDG